MVSCQNNGVDVEDFNCSLQILNLHYVIMV